MPKIEDIEISKLIPNPLNVKKHPKEQIHDLALQIQQEPGFTNPLVIDEDYMIWVGHGRLEAVKSLGWEKIPCIMVHNMSEGEKYRYMIKDNQVNESPWIKENLQIAFDKVDPILFEPFEMDIQDIGVKLPITEETEDIPEPPAEPKAKLGDVYQLGKHRVMCGDSTKDMGKLMITKAKITFTSPPYNIGYSSNLGGVDIYDKNTTKYNNNDDRNENYLEFLTQFTSNCMKHSDYQFINLLLLADNKVNLIEYLHKFRKYYVDKIVWDKEHGIPHMVKNVLNTTFEEIFIFQNKEYPPKTINSGLSFQGSIDNMYRGKSQKEREYSKIHKATFPIHLPLFIIEKFTLKDDIIIDPFLGTGTTLIACEQTNRICYGMELDPVYIDVIIERWENFTGLKAEKLPLENKPMEA